MDAVEIEGVQVAVALVDPDADPEARAVVDVSKGETASQTLVNWEQNSPGLQWPGLFYFPAIRLRAIIRCELA